MRIRHFRDGVELPWLAKDDNYDTNYQMNRMMRKPITIMQNDHLTVGENIPFSNKNRAFKKFYM